MSKLTKVVNIYPSMPITGVNPPIRSTVKRVTKSINEIRACLMARAIVEEILPSGKTVRLNISNYDKCLDGCNENGCTCGGRCGWVKQDVIAEAKVDEEKTPWQIAYETALAGKNLASMSRKQRRSVEAAARAAADAAVAVPEPEEVVMGVADIEIVEEVKEIESTENTEEVVLEEAVVEEAIEVAEEAPVVEDTVEAAE